MGHHRQKNRAVQQSEKVTVALSVVRFLVSCSLISSVTMSYLHHLETDQAILNLLAPSTRLTRWRAILVCNQYLFASGDSLKQIDMTYRNNWLLCLGDFDIWRNIGEIRMIIES